MIYLKAISALALVLGFIGLFYYLSQRLNERLTGGASKRRVQVIERTPLGDKRTLLLVQVGKQQLLLGATNNTISTLSEVVCEELPEESTSETTPDRKPGPKVSFRKILEAIR